MVSIYYLLLLPAWLADINTLHIEQYRQATKHNIALYWQAGNIYIFFSSADAVACVRALFCYIAKTPSVRSYISVQKVTVFRRNTFVFETNLFSVTHTVVRLYSSYACCRKRKKERSLSNRKHRWLSIGCGWVFSVRS